MSILLDPTGGERWDFDRAFSEAALPSPFEAVTGRHITFGDIDAEATTEGFLDEPDLALFETEINGQFLCIEGKRIGQELSRGQKRTNDARVITGRTVLIVFGVPPMEIGEAELWGTGERKQLDIHGLWRFCHRWATWASGQVTSTGANVLVSQWIDAQVQARAETSAPLPEGWSVRCIRNQTGWYSAFIDDEGGSYVINGNGFTKARAVEVATARAVERATRRSQTFAPASEEPDPFADLPF